MVNVLIFIFILFCTFTHVLPIYAADIIPLPPDGTVYYGAWASDEKGIQTNDSRDAFITLTDKKPAIIPYVIGDHVNYSNDCETNTWCQSGHLENIEKTYNAIPLITIQAKNRTLREMISNTIHPNDKRKNNHTLPDDFFKGWAQGLKTYGKPVFFRFAHEMSNESAWKTHPWAACGTENCKDLDTGEIQDPDLYIQAWRHIHDIFTAAGVTNVAWVWCPNRQENTISKTNQIHINKFYPGDNYVDWIALDVYNKKGWRSFYEIFKDEYQALLETTTTKPIMLAEFNSYLGEKNDRVEDKAKWITETFETVISKFPKIKAVVWFNVVADADDFRIEHDQKLVTAFKQAISSTNFLPNINPLIGDLNVNGMINHTDYKIFVTNFNKAGNNLVGDLNQDKIVDIFDYNKFVENFGK